MHARERLSGAPGGHGVAADPGLFRQWARRRAGQPEPQSALELLLGERLDGAHRHVDWSLQWASALDQPRGQ